MKKYFFICFLLASQTVLAQNLDSIMRVANVLPKGDTTRLKLLSFAAWNMQYADIDKAYTLCQSGLSEAQKFADTNNIYRLLVTIGTICQTKADWTNSINYFKQSIDFCTKAKKFKWLSTCYNNLANTYNVKGDFLNAINHYETSIELRKKYDPNEMIGDSYSNIGALYYHIQDTATALRKFKLGWQDTNLDVHTEFVILCNISNLYCSNDNKDSATKYLKIIADKLKTITNPLPENELLYYSSALEHQVKFSPNSKDLTMVDKAIALAKSTNNLNQISDFYRLKMKLLINQGQTDSAIFYGEASCKRSAELQQFFYLKNDYKLLSDLYLKKNDLKKAMEYMQLQNEASDSLFNQQIAESAVNAEARYDTKQKEEKNILLEKEKKAQSQLKNLYLILGIILSALFALIAYFIFRSKAKTEKLNKEIQLQKEILEKSNIFKSKMLSIISHDVRAPINGLRSLLQLKKTNLLSPDKLMEFDSKIENALTTSSMSLDNLLHWTVDEMQMDAPAKQESVVLHSIIKEDINFLSSIIAAKNITVVVTGNKEIMIQSDSNMLSLIIRNLVSNAVKYSSTSSQIIIETSQTNSNTSITIQDFGSGIAPDRLKKLGAQLVASETGTIQEKGVGLGHLLIAEYSKKIGANIVVESELGKGTKVMIVWEKVG
jgi:two-component system, sensor histidine kinase and response regulator